ncbi:GatB/YqeY domain-containing protein, partial [Patescibacteria group bacterium]|nr:GatB/YqeY domain-containing protein [Patescibacteria group bacterium]MBU1630048.1 GatB/YqeY domain-containing protein [Patescibacteria group bacterium]
KTAMREKNETVLSTLRMARSALKNKQIELQAELSDDATAAVLRTMVKQYRDALNDFIAAGREDLAEKQKQEIEILERYLPPSITEAELEAICRRVINEQNAELKDLGKVMGLVMKEVAGRADGNSVRSIVQKLLEG